MALRPDSDSPSFISIINDPLSSPSDGYFPTPSHPQEMFIDTEAANRGREVRVRVASPSAAPSQETTPLLDSFVGQGPPPSYLEATTPKLWDVRRRSEDEAARLLADPLDGLYKGPTFRKRSLREHCSRARILKWVAAILLIIVLAAILAAVTHGNNKTQVTPIPAQPVQSPVIPSQPQKDYPIRWPSRCGKEYNVKSEEFNFGAPSEFHIMEGVRQMDAPFKRVSGWIHVAQAPLDQPIGTLKAKFSYAASPSVDINSLEYSASATGLTIGDPSKFGLLNGLGGGAPCLGMSVVLYVASGAKLENFHVQSTHLGMQIYRGVHFSVTNATSISLTSGTLDASSLKSRETRLETVSGTISGKYALYDLLYVNTISGSVNINIEPMEEDLNKRSPAVFQAQSVSGSIRADTKREDIPERDYQVSIDTKVGSIDGTFIHGSRTSLQTIAGSINADILPFKSGDYASTLETDSRSGEIKVQIKAPYQNTGTIINKLTSTHKTISGAIDLTYPQEWEGHIDGSALSGALHLQGRDLRLIDETAQPGRNHVEARKGEGKSELTFSTVSGACEVKVGKL